MNNNRHSNGAFRAVLWLLSAGIGIQFFPSPARADEAAKPSPSSLPKVTAAEPGLAGSPTPTAGASQTTTTLPKVTKVMGLIALHETLEVDCDGLKEWANPTTNDPAKLILYLDGTQMKGLAPKIDKANANQLFFKLERLSHRTLISSLITSAFLLESGTSLCLFLPEPALTAPLNFNFLPLASVPIFDMTRLQPMFMRLGC